MAASPTLPIPEPTDVFEQLLACRKLLTAREVHELVGISEKTLYKYASLSLIPHYKIGANIRFRPRELAGGLAPCACLFRFA
jgi:predicted DNA-binding transcriptional regulator AlpA